MITPKENMRRVITGDGKPEWMPIASEDFDIVYPSELHERPPFGQDGYDWYGVRWTFEHGFMSFVQDPTQPLICGDITQWKEKVKLPDYSQYDWKAAAERDLAHADRENKMLRIFLECGAWERFHSLVGFEEAFVYMYEEPECFKELMQALTDSRKELIMTIYDAYHPDVIFDMNDLGSAKSSFMSPAMYREFIQPYQKQLVDVCHELGMFYLMHSCGTVDNLFADMIETGADVIQPVQGCNDWKKVKAISDGKVAIEGARHLRTEDLDADEADIRADIRSAIDIFAGNKRFIFDDYCLIPRNKEIMVDEAKQYGAELYT